MCACVVRVHKRKLGFVRVSVCVVRVHECKLGFVRVTVCCESAQV